MATSYMVPKIGFGIRPHAKFSKYKIIFFCWKTKNSQVPLHYSFKGPKYSDFLNQNQIHHVFEFDSAKSILPSDLAWQHDSALDQGLNDVDLITMLVPNDASEQEINIIVATPLNAGTYPVLLFLPGFFVPIHFYKQLLKHICSHGFIVVAAQLYTYLPQSTTEDVKSAAALTAWLPVGLKNITPKGVEADLEKLAIGGHSRGGHTAFALALGHGKTELKFSALIGIDPVAGSSKSSQAKPEILTYEPESFQLNGIPALTIGCGLGSEGQFNFMPPCAPGGLNHKQFYSECKPPRYHFELPGAGHMDILDDDASFFTRCICKNGKCRATVRSAIGAITIPFLQAFLRR